MSDLLPCPTLDDRDRSALAAHGVAHPRPFVASMLVGPEHLSRLVPHANNVEYLRWIDRVAELHADALGHTRAALLAAGRCFFVARHEIDYLGECWESERLLVATWVRTMKKTTSWRDTLIVRPSDGAAVCRATTLWAFVDLASRRPARIPPSLAETFEPLEVAGSGDADSARSAAR